MKKIGPFFKIIAEISVLLVPLIFILFSGFGLLTLLFSFGEKHFWPESYWRAKLEQVESKIQHKSEELQVCRVVAIKGHSQSSAMYSDLVRQGLQSQQAIELVFARQKGLDNSCLPHVDALLMHATELSAARAELARHQRE